MGYEPKLDENGKTPYYVGFVGYEKKDTELNYPCLYVYKPEKGDWGWIGYSWGDYIEEVKSGKFDIGNIWCECHEKDPTEHCRIEWRQLADQMEQVYPNMQVYMTLLPKNSMDELYPYGMEVSEEESLKKIDSIYEIWRKKIEPYSLYSRESFKYIW